MPALNNPKHEAFCQYLSEGKGTATKAYLAAGNSGSESAAMLKSTRLLQKDEIKARLRELDENAATRLGITPELLVTETAKIAFAHLATNVKDQMASASSITFGHDGRLKDFHVNKRSVKKARKMLDSLQITVTDKTGNLITAINASKLSDETLKEILLSKTD